MPKNPVTIITTDVKEAGSTSEAGPISLQLLEVVKAEDDPCTITSAVNEACCTEPDPILCQLDVVVEAVDELLELSLCQALVRTGKG